MKKQHKKLSLNKATVSQLGGVGITGGTGNSNYEPCGIPSVNIPCQEPTDDCTVLCSVYCPTAASCACPTQTCNTYVRCSIDSPCEPV
jgi:hypothetical protein